MVNKFKVLISFIILVLLTVQVSFAIVIPSYNATFTYKSSVRGNESVLSTSAPDAGNITRLEIDITQNTKKWAGYYGNVTGSFQLGSSGSSLIEFDAIPSSDFKGVFATFDQTFNFAAVQSTNNGNSKLDTTVGIGAVVDNATRVFKETMTRFNVAGLYGARMTTWNHTGSFGGPAVNQTRQNQTMDTVIISDAANPANHRDLAFAATVVTKASNGNQLRSYDNSTFVDFEMIVLTNDSDGDGDPNGDTTYYFYLQIN